MMGSVALSDISKKTKQVELDATRCLEQINNDPNRNSLGYGYYRDGAKMFKEIFSIRDRYHSLLKEADETLLENTAPANMPKEVSIYTQEPAIIDIGHDDKILYDEARNKVTQIIKQCQKITDILGSLPSNPRSNHGHMENLPKSLGYQEKYDIFLCHAMADKNDIAQPLAIALKNSGIHVWYDEYELKWGKSLRQMLEKGLTSCKYGIVLISKNFLDLDDDSWAQKELSAIFNSDKILPVWYNVTFKDVNQRMPIIAERYAMRINSDSMIPDIVKKVKEILSN